MTGGTPYTEARCHGLRCRLRSLRFPEASVFAAKCSAQLNLSVFAAKCSARLNRSGFAAKCSAQLNRSVFAAKCSAQLNRSAHYTLQLLPVLSAPSMSGSLRRLTWTRSAGKGSSLSHRLKPMTTAPSTASTSDSRRLVGDTPIGVIWMQSSQDILRTRNGEPGAKSNQSSSIPVEY